MSSQGNNGGPESPACSTLSLCLSTAATPSTSSSASSGIPLASESVVSAVQENTLQDCASCKPLTPSPMSGGVQQNTNSSSLKMNQSFQGTSCLMSDISHPVPQVVKHVVQPGDQQAQQQGPLPQSQGQQSVQQLVTQDQQLQQSQHFQQEQELQCHQEQQLLQCQQLQQSQHVQSSLQIQHGQQGQLQLPLQLQQGQQILTQQILSQQQSQPQHVQQLLQQQQQQSQLQHGQQILQQAQNQSQVQQLLQQQQQSQQQHNQQLIQQHSDQQSQGQQHLLQQQQSHQQFFQHQGQPLMQQQGTQILQQQTGHQQLQQQYQQQIQPGQRFLQQPGQPMVQQPTAQQQLLQQQGHQQVLQSFQPLGQQQIVQQSGQQQQQLLQSLQPSGQALFQAVQPGQPGLFQQQTTQQLLQTQLGQSQLLQSQPNQLMQQQQFQTTQQLLQQQQTQQLMQQQQLNSLQQQIVLQAIQGSGQGVITSRPLSFVQSGSSVGLVNTVPTNVYRQIASSAAGCSTSLVTQLSKSSQVSSSISCSRGAPGQQPLQRQTSAAAVQVVPQRQNAPLFIGQFGMASNATIIPSGIVPLVRPQGSGSVTVQPSGGQTQILASPTQIQLTTPLLANTGNILNPQTLQAAMAQLQQQQGTTLLTSQPLFIQTGISIPNQPGNVGGLAVVSSIKDNLTSATSLATSVRADMTSGSVQPAGLGASLPVHIAIGTQGLAHCFQQRSTSWPVSTTSVEKASFSQLQTEVNLTNILPITCQESALPLPMETVALGITPSCRGQVQFSGQNFMGPLALEVQPAAGSQGRIFSDMLGNSSGLLTTFLRHDGVKPEKFPSLSKSSSCTIISGQANGLMSSTDAGQNSALSGEKQTAKVKPQILTHIIEGFVIQEGPEPFPVQRSSFINEFLESTDEMTDSSCDGQSEDEMPDEKKAPTVKSIEMSTCQEVEKPQLQSQLHKESSKLCTYCAKQYELPSFGRSGKFCSQTCAKRSAATSRWTMYQINKRNDALSSNKPPVKKRSSNINGRGWIRRSSEIQNATAAQPKPPHLQNQMGISVNVPVPITVVPLKVGHQQQTATTALDTPCTNLVHGSYMDNSNASNEHDAAFSLQQQQHTPSVPLLVSPGHDSRADITHQLPSHPSAATAECQAVDSSPNHKHPSEWGVHEVYTFVKSLPGCSSYAEEFRLQEIDGQALLLLKEDHLMTTLNLKLGPALKICQQISALKDSFS